MGTRVDDPHGKYVTDFSLTDTDKGKVNFSSNDTLSRVLQSVFK